MFSTCTVRKEPLEVAARTRRRTELNEGKCIGALEQAVDHERGRLRVGAHLTGTNEGQSGAHVSQGWYLLLIPKPEMIITAADSNEVRLRSVTLLGEPRRK